MAAMNIFYDLDGTPVDSLPGIEFSVIEAMPQCRPYRSVQGLRSIIGPPIRLVLRELLGDIR